jgi:Winged helix DNA-binding domain
MRMTIHLIPTDDAGWWLPLFEPGIEKWSRRRLEQLGMPPRIQEQALQEVFRMLGEEGPLTRTEVGNRLRGIGIKLDNMTRGHIMGLAVTSGNACLGPDRSGSSCLVLRRDWLAKQRRRFDRDAALAELARRYLRAFGPATDRDFAYWSGLGLGEVRGGLESIAKELEEVSVGTETMLALRGKLPRLPPVGQLRMLGNFDTYLLGWKDRRFSVPDEHAERVKEGGGGWIRPVIVRDGVVIGGWRSARKGSRIEISHDLPDAVTAGERKAIDAEIRDIERFEGLPVNVASA